MKQQHEQRNNNLSNETAIIPQNSIQQTPPTLSGSIKYRIMDKHGMTEQEWAIYDAEVSIGLLTLRTAYPTQTRNYSDREHDILTALWLEIFAEVEPGTLREAIMRFVATDRKGFFPSPGQIMGVAEDIIAERQAREKAEQTARHYEYLRQLQQRIDNGENCSTCRSCVTRKVENIWDKTDKTGLFCQNPASYKYEGERGYGTAASILCDYYEPKNDNESEAALID